MGQVGPLRAALNHLGWSCVGRYLSLSVDWLVVKGLPICPQSPNHPCVTWDNLKGYVETKWSNPIAGGLDFCWCRNLLGKLNAWSLERLSGATQQAVRKVAPGWDPGTCQPPPAPQPKSLTQWSLPTPEKLDKIHFAPFWMDEILG